MRTVELDHERSIDSQSADRECEYVCSVPSEFLDEILQKLDLTYKKSHQQQDLVTAKTKADILT